MGSDLVAVLNAITHNAGVKDIQLLRCDETNQCVVRRRDLGGEVSMSLEWYFDLIETRSHFLGPPHLIRFVVRTPGWFLIDTAEQDGPEHLVLREGTTWRTVTLPPTVDVEATHRLSAYLVWASQRANAEERHQLVEALQKGATPPQVAEFSQKELGWEGYGLSLDSAAFGRFAAPFFATSPPEASAAPLFGPGDRVSLAGHPDIAVPWHDPVLLGLWRQFLTAQGLRVTEEAVTYRGLPIVRISSTNAGDAGKTYEFFLPNGQAQKMVTVAARDRRVAVQPIPGRAGHYQVDINGAAFHAEVPLRDGETVAEAASMLRDMVQPLTLLPTGMLRRMATGIGREKGLQFLLASADEAERYGFENPVAAGMYNPRTNTLWVERGNSSMGKNILHEFGGHGWDDLMCQGSAIWRSKTVKAALVPYFVRQMEMAFGGKRPSLLGPPVKALEKYFLSVYAATGPLGQSSIWTQAKQPLEMYAVSVAHFYQQPEEWVDSAADVPILWLIALEYLAHEYDVTRIGEIPTAKLFSQETFAKIGVALPTRQEAMKKLQQWWTAAGFLGSP